MRYFLSLLAILSAHQATYAIDQLHSSVKRALVIQGFKYALDNTVTIHPEKARHIDTKELAAIIEQLSETSDKGIHDVFLGVLKALGREKTAAITTEQINKVVNALYLRALEIAQEKEFTREEIAKELAMEQHSEEVKRALTFAGYVRNLVLEETTRTLFDYTWSAVANRLVTKKPSAAQPAQP